MRSIVVLFAMVFFFSMLANAQIYRYTDEEGVVRFTDDLAQVPPDQRPKTEQYEEYDTGSTQVEEAGAAGEKSGRGEADDDSSTDEEEAAVSPESQDAAAQDAAAQDAAVQDGESQEGEYDFETNYKRLEQEREDLAREYEAMLQEKAALEEEQKLEEGEKLSESEIAKRNEKIRDFNERVKKYRKKRELFEKQKADYNARAVKKMEKTIQEHKAEQAGGVAPEKD